MGLVKTTFLSFCAVLALAAPSLGQTTAGAPPPFPDFTFRMVPARTSDQSGPRINVQIGDTQPEAPMPTVRQTPPDPIPTASDWFWAAIPAGREAGAGRFSTALDLLATAPEAADLPVMRADGLLALAEEHGAQLMQATVGTRISPALALAVMAVESRGDPAAHSRAGAQGLMQLIPATAERFGVANSLDASQNIAGGVAYLDWLMAEFDRDPILVLAGYNAGEGAVRAAGGVPDFPETRDYIPQVLATWRAARLLCLTPPELVSDGCVFRTMVATSG
ncbi:lytic transglycosylase domain-containing protein [Nioella nitratireducens]|uniref:lytic transglycosylase domain-containing protein n=1 Tax=Nioella nitratireducens TaxID=1287720 RepID=UPI0008FD8826|nr:lytic transglycosylase domain-containing protein [Nioella nitratireducens]